MKNLSLVGKINIGLGIFFFLGGVVMLILKKPEGFALNNIPFSISFILIGITIFLTAGFYRKEEN